MVQRIRLRGHVIRLYGLSPNSSRSRPKCCPTCGTLYNDGSHRRCFYLCCEFDDCFNCVINMNKFHCHKFTELCRLRKIKQEVVQQEEEEEDMEKETQVDGENLPGPSCSIISTGNETVEKATTTSININGGINSSDPPLPPPEKTDKCNDNPGDGSKDEEPPIVIKKEPEDKDKSKDLRIEFVKITPRQWLPLVILERVEALQEKVKEENVDVETMEGLEETGGMVIGRGMGRRGRRRGSGIISPGRASGLNRGSSVIFGRRGPGRPRGGVGGDGGTFGRRGPGRPRGGVGSFGRGGARAGAGRPRRVRRLPRRRRSTRLIGSTKNPSEA